MKWCEIKINRSASKRWNDPKKTLENFHEFANLHFFYANETPFMHLKKPHVSMNDHSPLLVAMSMSTSTIITVDESSSSDTRIVADSTTSTYSIAFQEGEDVLWRSQVSFATGPVRTANRGFAVQRWLPQSHPWANLSFRPKVPQKSKLCLSGHISSLTWNWAFFRKVVEALPQAVDMNTNHWKYLMFNTTLLYLLTACSS